MGKKKQFLRIAICQINSWVGDFASNTRKIISFIKEAESKGCAIAAFPELAVCGYPPEDLLFKNSFVGENIKCLKDIARQTANILAVVGFADKKGAKLYNGAALLGRGRILDIYHKVHLPNYGVFDEKRYFASGEGFKLYPLSPDVCLGINICEDIWVNDGVISEQSRAGANLILTINSSPYHMGKIHLRQKVLREQARKNKAFILYVNLVGGQDELVFDGQSMLVTDTGRVSAIAEAFKEDLRVVDIDISKLPKKSRSKKAVFLPLKIGKNKRTAEALPITSPRNIGPVEEIFSALVLGTRDYLLKNGFKRALLGLSGGIDSSLVACIAKEALGSGNVIGLILPSKFNSRDSYADAVSLADNLGIEYKVIAIQDIFEDYIKTLKPHFQDRPWNVAEENLQARVRGNILMALSNKFGWLVLTTGNKSEMGVGYATLYGDMAGGFAVIKDVPKTLVYKLSEFYNQKAGKEIIPRRVFDKAPTAELRENQKDSDSLPEYAALDAILKAYVEEDLPAGEIIKKGFDKAEVSRTMRLVDLSEYKRRQGPPGVKITPRAFGKDRRMPITNRFREVV
ncbi:MAG TPA: NAD+ synthase [Candidatus Omnitrophota bacterium]|nr:NAD+ synthase [Candidatus Omnitrophota bacterium]